MRDRLPASSTLLRLKTWVFYMDKAGTCKPTYPEATVEVTLVSCLTSLYFNVLNAKRFDVKEALSDGPELPLLMEKGTPSCRAV